MSFIFDANKGETPQSVARKRQIAEQIMGRGFRPVSSVGEGIGAGLMHFGDAIRSGRLTTEADDAERAGLAEARDAFNLAMPSGNPMTGAIADAMINGTTFTPPSRPAGNASGLAGFATGGAMRPDSFSGMNGDFASGLSQLFAAAPPEIQKQLQVSSGYRSPERQGQLWQEALTKYGSPEEARKWVAPPGRSQHNHGNAADLKYLSPEAQQWAHANAGRFGLSFPLGNENWHIELASARGGDQAQLPPGAQPTQGQAQQSGGDRLHLLAKAIASPFMPEGERAVLQAEYQREVQARDPMRQAQLEQLRLENERLRSPQRPLLNAGDGRLYDQNTGEWIRAPDAGNRFRQASPEEAQRYGAPAGQFGPDGRFYPVNPPSGSSLIVDPQTGAVTFTQGAGVRPLTEQQSKDTVYATRARGAQTILDANEVSLAGAMDNAVAGMPFGNYGVSDGYQKARQAGDEFLLSILRKDTGAAITADERKEYGTVYLPRPGDSTALIDQKRQARHRALGAIEAGMPPAAILQQERALEKSRESGGAPSAAVDALRQNPQRAAEFDAKYGQGAAARILGQ